MYYQLSRLGLCVVKQKRVPNQLSGSSRFKCGNYKIVEKSHGINPYDENQNKKYKVKKVKQAEKSKSYGLRKTKIRQKILNFFSLNASKKFCAFYSISFPMEIADDIAYKVLNTWLTRCRSECGLRSYLWVAERQKNGTLHFHLITNNYMHIRKVNEFMRQCLYTQWNKGKLKCKEESIKRYNGVDVDNLYYSKRNKNKGKRLSRSDSQRKLSMYLSKYISKNDTKSNRLPWHCSRDISALFISINYNDVDNLAIAKIVADNPEAVVSYDKEFFTMHFFKFIPEEHYFKDLTEANNLIYETFNPN